AVYTNTEAQPTALITVTRTGPTAGSVSVGYRTAAGGTATSPQDYTPTTGTLSFTPGLTTKTFIVRLANDTLVDGDKTVNLALENPSTGGLLGLSQAVLLIKDNDL